MNIIHILGTYSIYSDESWFHVIWQQKERMIKKKSANDKKCKWQRVHMTKSANGKESKWIRIQMTKSVKYDKECNWLRVQMTKSSKHD